MLILMAVPFANDRLALYRKREKPREDRNSRDAENGRVPKQDATVHVHCRCICVTLSFLESQE